MYILEENVIGLLPSLPVFLVPLFQIEKNSFFNDANYLIMSDESKYLKIAVSKNREVCSCAIIKNINK